MEAGRYDWVYIELTADRTAKRRIQGSELRLSKLVWVVDGSGGDGGWSGEEVHVLIRIRLQLSDGESGLGNDTQVFDMSKRDTK